jgi:hypothetical protein
MKWNSSRRVLHVCQEGKKGVRVMRERDRKREEE